MPERKYSPETIAAYGKLIEVSFGQVDPDEDRVLPALRHLAMMVHCDLTGELRGPHTHDDAPER